MEQYKKIFKKRGPGELWEDWLYKQATQVLLQTTVFINRSEEGTEPCAGEGGGGGGGEMWRETHKRQKSIFIQVSNIGAWRADTTRHLCQVWGSSKERTELSLESNL